jgi:hypothetical protein
MFKQILTPSSNHLILDIPDNLVGHKVEVTAEAIQRNKKKRKKYSLKENRQFYEKYSFGTLSINFSREELYDR